MVGQFLDWYNGLTDSLLGTVVLFILGVWLLIKGGDWFVDSAVAIAKRFHVPEVIIGATVVSVGTTLPEVMVGASAAMHNNGGIAYGNAMGSIICNAALIAALTVAIRPGPVDRKAIGTPMMFFFAAAAVYMASAYIFGRFDRWVGILLLLIFFVYMAASVRWGLSAKGEEGDVQVHGPLLQHIGVLIVSAGLIAVGADMLEGSAVSLATMAGVPGAIVGVTVVALCTSLPELVTAVTALTKGHGALSLGNIIGANIFNLVLVSGIAVSVSPFPVPVDSKLFGYNTSLLLELPLMVGVMALLCLPAWKNGKLCRWQGVVLLGIYGSFMAVQILIALGIL